MAKTSPLSGKLVALTGGSGFLGTHVAQALLERGARLRIVSRDPKKAWHLKPLADLGQLQFAALDVRKADHAKAAVSGADAVVNLVGSFDGDLMRLIAGGAKNVAEAATEEGASAFVHVSAIGADGESEATYARAKARSEEFVLEAFSKATVIRPSLLYGKEDEFVNMLAQLVKLFPVLPVFAPDAKLAMLWVDDAAEAIANALEDPAKHGGKTYEIGGPEAISMMELNERIAAGQRRRRAFIPVPDPASGVFAALPGTPMGRDQWILLKQGNVPSGDYPGIEKLGVNPKPLSLFLEKWMVRYRRHGRFTEEASA